jgi:hypothetical protein
LVSHTGDRLAIALWLADAAGPLPASETYASFDVDGAYAGLGVSTITHAGDVAAVDAAPAATFAVVDWRSFAATCDRVRVDVALADGPLPPFVGDLGHPTALQGQVAAFCRLRGLDAASCAALDFAARGAARRAAAAKRAGLPAVQERPSPDAPFVFLHHEKTAGSSLRRHVVAAAKRLGVGFFVPCYDGGGVYREDERCYAFDARNASAANGGAPSAVAAAAGHFEWGVWRELPAARADPPPCLTMVRHPVDRAVSLYYERVFQRDDLGGVPLNDMAVEDFEWLLRAFKGSAFSKYRDDGFCDTMCKSLLGLSLYRGRGERDLADLEAARPDLFAAYDAPLDAAEAVARQARCVVGLQDDWPAAKRAIAHWFPWLDVADDDRRNAGYTDQETRDTLRPDLRAAVLRCNACDAALYAAAVARRDAQEAHLAASS